MRLRRSFNAVSQQALLPRTGRPVIGWSARGREDGVWAGPGRVPGGCRDFWVTQRRACGGRRSPPVPVKSPCRQERRAPTSSPAGQSHTRRVRGLLRTDVSPSGVYEVLLPGKTAGGRGDERCLGGLAEVDEDARGSNRLSVTKAIVASAPHSGGTGLGRLHLRRAKQAHPWASLSLRCGRAAAPGTRLERRARAPRLPCCPARSRHMSSGKRGTIPSQGVHRIPISSYHPASYPGKDLRDVSPARRSHILGFSAARYPGRTPVRSRGP